MKDTTHNFLRDALQDNSDAGVYICWLIFDFSLYRGHCIFHIIVYFWFSYWFDWLFLGPCIVTLKRSIENKPFQNSIKNSFNNIRTHISRQTLHFSYFSLAIFRSMICHIFGHCIFIIHSPFTFWSLRLIVLCINIGGIILSETNINKIIQTLIKQTTFHRQTKIEWKLTFFSDKHCTLAALFFWAFVKFSVIVSFFIVFLSAFNALIILLVIILFVSKCTLIEKREFH